MFVPKTRVVRAGYVVDLNVWGGVCVFWQVTLEDRGVASWLGAVDLWDLSAGGDGKGKARSVGDRASCSSLELGPHLVPFWKSGGLEVGAVGDRFFVSQRPRPTGLRP